MLRVWQRGSPVLLANAQRRTCACSRRRWSCWRTDTMCICLSTASHHATLLTLLQRLKYVPASLRMCMCVCM
jgi:hypothetical protein